MRESILILVTKVLRSLVPAIKKSCTTLYALTEYTIDDRYLCTLVIRKGSVIEVLIKEYPLYLLRKWIN
jgi:hypothetical protein